MTADCLLRKLTGFKVSSCNAGERKRYEGWVKLMPIQDAVNIGWHFGNNDDELSAKATYWLKGSRLSRRRKKSGWRDEISWSRFKTLSIQADTLLVMTADCRPRKLTILKVFKLSWRRKQRDEGWVILKSFVTLSRQAGILAVMTTDCLLRKLTPLKVPSCNEGKRKRYEGWVKLKPIQDAVNICWHFGNNDDGRNAQKTHSL